MGRSLAISQELHHMLGSTTEGQSLRVTLAGPKPYTASTSQPWTGCCFFPHGSDLGQHTERLRQCTKYHPSLNSPLLASSYPPILCGTAVRSYYTVLTREGKDRRKVFPFLSSLWDGLLALFYVLKRAFEIHTNEYLALPPENGKAALGNGIHPPKIKGEAQARKDNTPPSTLRLAQTASVSSQILSLAPSLKLHHPEVVWL